ncbi:HAD family hydrolase [Mangrovicella endophytica]|uniref:HAD family hydrolase n=1 Tax=Mangrovicella endophytica TaxID=2066697 RepID=UPI000C9E0851|nr:HAD family hydrolase [Mangrovicella endophytica]
MNASTLPLKGVLFDKDGTLLDFDATWGPATAAVLAALADGDETRIDALADACGFRRETLGFDPTSPIIAGDPGSFVPTWAEMLGLTYDAGFIARVDGLYRAESLRSLKGYADVSTGIDALVAAGLKIGLATNDSEVAAKAHLEAMGVADRFDFICGYDSGFGAKPLPGMVEAFAKAIGAEAAEVVMIGDSAHDIETARRAGARAIGIARTPAAAAALDGHADVIVMDLAGLADELGLRGRSTVTA